METTKRALQALILGAALGLVLSEVAFAQDEEGCFEMCREEGGAGDCRFDAKQAKRLCVEEGGCEALREVYLDACHVQDRDEASCDEARASFRACVSPCHEQFHAQMQLCREQMASCLEAACGIELPEVRERHGFRGHPRR